MVILKKVKENFDFIDYFIPTNNLCVIAAGKKSILLVEDDAVVRDMIKFVLERKYKVLEASRYSEAVNLLKNPIDLAIIDYSLPDKDGFDVLKAVRKARPSIPVIIITAYSSESLAIKAVRAGATDYIKKPLSLKDLMKRLSEILEGENSNGYSEEMIRRYEFIMDGITSYIENNYNKDLTLDKLARIACMDKYKFCRAFKEKFGQGFRSYLNRIRIRNAAELLKNLDLSITEIAFFVGYGSVEHFERVFKKSYRVSPREYRGKLEQ
jgi:YesN/AraC family two-component response regulator